MRKPRPQPNPLLEVRMRLDHFALITTAALGLSACAGMVDTPAQATLRDATSLGLPVAQSTDAMPDAQWWRSFGDQQLDRLLEQALASSPSLKMAQARIARAQAAVGLAQAASAAQLGAGVDVTLSLIHISEPTRQAEISYAVFCL